MTILPFGRAARTRDGYVVNKNTGKEIVVKTNLKNNVVGITVTALRLKLVPAITLDFDGFSARPRRGTWQLQFIIFAMDSPPSRLVRGRTFLVPQQYYPDSDGAASPSELTFTRGLFTLPVSALDTIRIQAEICYSTDSAIPRLPLGKCGRAASLQCFTYAWTMSLLASTFPQSA
jgi:hypothetical protein